MGFSRDDVEGLSAQLGEPGWVLERRLSAWSLAEKMELPAERESEDWRYTDFRRLKFKLDPFRPARPAAATEIIAEAEALLREEGERAGYLIQRDADVVRTELDPALAREGVILTDLGTAIREHGDLVKEHLFSEIDPSLHLFSALHQALFCGGTFLFVPRGVRIPIPIESQRWIDEGGVAVFPHNLIVVEEGAEASYFERFASTEIPSHSLSNGAMELICGKGSRVSFVSLQEYGEQVWHFQVQRAISAADVTLRSLVVTLGGRFSRVETGSSIRGQGSTSEMLGLYFAQHGQHFDHRTLQEHVAAGTTSDLLYKGAVTDESRAVYSGLIRVHERAAKTDAYQANRNLVLSDHAKADSKPELEILNNDVRCTHGASIGQIEEEEIYYLMSRGISRDEATRLIVFGFFEDVVGKIQVEEVRKVLLEAIEGRLGR